MDFLLTLHGEIRWLVALVGVIAIIKFAFGWLGKRPYTSLDRALMSGFTILLDINLLLGTILLFALPGGFPRDRLEHAFTMLLAVIVAHLSIRWRNSDNPALIFRNNLIVIVAALVLIFIGVTMLRGGWMF